MALLAYIEKQAEALFRLIFSREKHCSDRKNKLKSTDYKPAEQGQRSSQDSGREIKRDQDQIHLCILLLPLFLDKSISRVVLSQIFKVNQIYRKTTIFIASN
jgi:hypothetical protein